MEAEQKARLYRIVKPMAILLLVGIAYAIFVKVTGLAIPCMIRMITGKHCPGCGISRMCMALLHLDFKEAMQQNCLLFFLLPVLLVYGIWKAVTFVKYGDRPLNKVEQAGTLVLFVLMVAFWILRNTERFAFLAPRV